MKKIVNYYVEEVAIAVKKENEWSHHYTNMTLSGKKYFSCNKVNARGTQCDAGIYLLFDSTIDKVILFRATSSHFHDSMSEKPSRTSNNGAENQVNQFQNQLIGLVSHHMKLFMKIIY